MTKNTKVVWLAGMGLLLCLLAGLFVRDRYLTGGMTACGDPEGPRPAIDLRRFETNYTGYSVSLEAEITGKGKLTGKIEPAALQKLSQSIQNGQEFRKALVAGYNACAVSRSAYQAAVLRFQSLDGLAQQIDTLAGKTSLRVDARLTSLIFTDWVQWCNSIAAIPCRV
jgi:hypothetical protein